MIDIIEHKDSVKGTVYLEVVEVDEDGNVIEIKETTDKMPIGMEKVIKQDLEDKYDI